MTAPTPISELASRTGSPVVVKGWVRRIRSSGRIAFLVVRDGTGEVQCVFSRADLDDATWQTLTAAEHESTVAVTGEVCADKRSPIGVEVSANSLRVLSGSPEFPIQPKEHGIDFLLEHRHLWLRSPRQVALMRIRDETMRAIRDFLHEDGFTCVDTPILTGAIGESAGTLFETEYFDLGTAYLAQTGQLYVETAAAALGKVYCFGPTFRAEKSKTRRHLTEFWMVEPEVAWMDSDGNMDLQERMVCYVAARVLDRCQADLGTMGRDLDRLAAIVPPFNRMSYTDAVARLQEAGHEIEWGSDLGAGHEAALTEGRSKPLFVHDYPKRAKAFYMKENPDNPATVKCNDLLAPEGYGEIIGGSQREDDYDRLLARIREEGLPEESYGWYLDLRKYGTFPHSGFGLGLERTVAWLSGAQHLRETIAYPRMMTRITP
ncbi:MAG: asparagine--tRNA ligase [Gemmatimonadetes bacterium]|nr:asparagine--tRNA ligase [Gemmatimonadota bacterium]